LHHGGILVVFILDEDGAAINRLRLLLPLLLEKSVKMCLLAIGQPVNIFFTDLCLNYGKFSFVLFDFITYYVSVNISHFLMSVVEIYRQH